MERADIISKINRLTSELPLVKKIAEISEHEGLEIAFNELTDNCCCAIKSKNYKSSKAITKSLEAVNNFKKYIDEQAERANRIEAKIAELRIELTRCQLSLFAEKNEQKIATGITYNKRELFSGDTFETSKHDYLLIIEATTTKTPNFAIISTKFEEEMLLSYPQNLEILKDTAYLGNIFDDEK